MLLARKFIGQKPAFPPVINDYVSNRENTITTLNKKSASQLYAIHLIENKIDALGLERGQLKSYDLMGRNTKTEKITQLGKLRDRLNAAIYPNVDVQQLIEEYKTADKAGYEQLIAGDMSRAQRLVSNIAMQPPIQIQERDAALTELYLKLDTLTQELNKSGSTDKTKLNKKTAIELLVTELQKQDEESLALSVKEVITRFEKQHPAEYKHLIAGLFSTEARELMASLKNSFCHKDAIPTQLEYETRILLVHTSASHRAN